MFATRKVAIALTALTLSLAAPFAVKAQSYELSRIRPKLWTDDIRDPWNTSYQIWHNCDFIFRDVYVPMGTANQLEYDCSPSRKRDQIRLQQQEDWCNCPL